MCPTDLISLFITLFGQILGGDSYIDVDKGFDIRTGETVLDIIRKIKSISHPDSLDSNPICVLDRMSTQNDIAYSPFIFGYTNYSRQGYRDNIVLFDDAPLLPNAQCSTMLGGTGLAVSMKSRYKKEAVDYVLYATRTSIQKGIYFTCGGQPADLHAWLSPHNNEECGNFFTNTLKTLQTAFVRPKVIGWNKFQEEAGNVLNEALRGSNDNRSIVEKINALYTKLCHS
jgi:multiple sugar transport system substrate-binding protein